MPNSTKRKPKPKGPTSRKDTAQAHSYQQTRAALRKQLALDLARVLANPECPIELYNAIGEEITDWSSAYCNKEHDTPGFIETCLNYHIESEERRRAI